MDNEIMLKKNQNTFTMDGSDFISKNLSNSAIGLYCLINYLCNTLGRIQYLHIFLDRNLLIAQKRRYLI